MSFDFKETITIEVPDLDRDVASFSEAFRSQEQGLIIEIAAIHEGLTQNYNHYSESALEGSLSAWVHPYPKPIILNHDLHSEPVGRVMAAKMEHESDGIPFVMLQAAITDPAAIEKVMDQRYLTGSVGGKAGKANCSVCNADWAEASMFDVPCKHRRGKTYKGKLAFMEISEISWKEFSFVNSPADQRAIIRGVKAQVEENSSEESEGWVRAAKLFSVNMNKEEVLSFSESAKDGIDILQNRDKKEASLVHMQIKGGFLSALAAAEQHNEEDMNSLAEETQNKEDDQVSISDEEKKVKTVTNDGDEDILAITEELSSDLENSTEEEEVSSEVEEEESSSEMNESDQEEAESTEEVEESEEEENSTTESEEVSEEDEAADQEVEEEEKTTEATATAEEEEEASTTEGDEETSEEQDAIAEEEQEQESDTTEDDGESETELNESETIETLESRVEELESERDTLREENDKLRKALKRNLAERVVDAKIAVGMIESNDRDAQVSEHVERSASSLADSLRDLSEMSPKRGSSASVPTVTEPTSVSEEGEPVIDEETIEEHENQEEFDPEEKAISRMVDVLMGRVQI